MNIRKLDAGLYGGVGYKFKQANKKYQCWEWAIIMDW